MGSRVARDRADPQDGDDQGGGRTAEGSLRGNLLLPPSSAPVAVGKKPQS
ncbi:hypothetical protein [Mycobacterium pseudokansasii]|nr:hypothetical protein [Mycobacterium pseudokansasii]MBY0387275.1 hypothetical protein [Mycobacterium pseudokansasii]